MKAEHLQAEWQWTEKLISGEELECSQWISLANCS